MSGWLGLSASELKAWAELTGNVVHKEEWQIIRDMDAAFLKAASAGASDIPPPPEHDISVAAFDAVFG